MREVVIASSVRTAVGKSGKGTLRATRPDDLAAVRFVTPTQQNQEYTVVSAVTAATVQELNAAGENYPDWVRQRYFEEPRCVSSEKVGLVLCDALLWGEAFPNNQLCIRGSPFGTSSSLPFDGSKSILPHPLILSGPLRASDVPSSLCALRARREIVAGFPTWSVRNRRGCNAFEGEFLKAVSTTSAQKSIRGASAVQPLDLTDPIDFRPAWSGDFNGDTLPLPDQRTRDGRKD